MKFELQLVFALSIALFATVQGSTLEDGLYKEAIGFVRECSNKELSLCMKERALKFIDRLPSNIDLGAGIKIKQIDTERTSRQHKSIDLPEEPRAREVALENAIMEKISDFIGSHTVEFKLPTDTVNEFQRSMVEEGRKKQGGGGGGGGKKGGMNMMMLFMMKAALLGGLALKAIGLIAFKALLIAKVALTISVIIALKKLLGDKHHTATYEVVAHPQHDDHGGHWDRSFGADLAYSGHLDSKYSPTRY